MCARHCFRQLTQAPEETIRQFATRLRRAVKDCSYGEDTDNQIRDEILCKCSNTYIKRKLLAEGRCLTPAKSLEIAENCEKVDAQLAAMSLERKEENSAVIGRIREKRRGSGKKNQSHDPHKDLEPTCYRWGITGHFGSDPVCPARGQFCRKCRMEGDFQERCKTKQKSGAKQAKVRHDRDPKKGVAKMVNVQDNEDTSVYAFAGDNMKQEKIEVILGGCKLNMIVDSGASTNIIDKQTWEWLKKNKVKCKSARSDRKLYHYASQTPLDVIGTLCCKVITGANSINAEFCVLGRGDPLLGKETATNLGVLKIGIEVAAVHASSKNIGEILQANHATQKSSMVLES